MVGPFWGRAILGFLAVYENRRQSGMLWNSPGTGSKIKNNDVKTVAFNAAGDDGRRAGSTDLRALAQAPRASA